MGGLIVEEDVRLEDLKGRGLIQAAKEVSLINAHSPLTQGVNDPHVRGCVARGDQSSANGSLTVRELILDPLQRSKEGLERTRIHRTRCVLDFVSLERREPFLLEDLLGFIPEQNCVTVEGNSNLGDVAAELDARRRKNECGGYAGSERLHDGRRLSRQE